jgi:hypothetical protein
MTPEPTPMTFNLEEAAIRIGGGVQPDALRRAVRKGALKASKIGNCVVTWDAALKEYIQGSQIVPSKSEDVANG